MSPKIFLKKENVSQIHMQQGQLLRVVLNSRNKLIKTNLYQQYNQKDLATDVLDVVIRVPEDDETTAFGEVKQGKDCMDTLGHSFGGTVGLFECHGSGGNQVS